MSAHTQVPKEAEATTRPAVKNVDGDDKLTWQNVVGASRPPMWFASAFPYLMCLEGPLVGSEGRGRGARRCR